VTLRIAPAREFDADALAACFTAAFDGYLAGSFTMDAAALPRFLARQGADLALSRAVVRDGALAGVAFVGAYADRRRLCAMGVRAPARGSGASKALLQQVIAEARAAHAASLELEVFVQNTPAVRLYRSAGFVDGPALWGFMRAAGGSVEEVADEPDVVSLEEAAGWLLLSGPDDLPYQVSGYALRHADVTQQPRRLGEALLVFGQAAVNERLVVNVLVDADPAQADAARLLRWLVARYPGHAIHVPQLMRDDVAARALRAAGFDVLALHQMQMRLPLG
jgi:ribosomal protein S18 acetylase RimI-like enzyme